MAIIYNTETSIVNALDFQFIDPSGNKKSKSIKYPKSTDAVKAALSAETLSNFNPLGSLVMPDAASTELNQVVSDVINRTTITDFLNS